MNASSLFSDTALGAAMGAAQSAEEVSPPSGTLQQSADSQMHLSVKRGEIVRVQRIYSDKNTRGCRTLRSEATNSRYLALRAVWRSMLLDEVLMMSIESRDRVRAGN